MNACRREADVLRAAREERWPDSLRHHLGECEECAMAASVAPWMTAFERMDARTHRLPDPSVVWLKAKLLQGTIDAARASRPLNVVQLVGYLVVAGGWAGVVTSNWEAISKWLHGRVTPGSLLAASGSLSVSFFAVVFLLASMSVMLALHTILAEE